MNTKCMVDLIGKKEKSPGARNIKETVKNRKTHVNSWHGCPRRRRVNEGLNVLLGPLIKFLVKFRILVQSWV